MICYKLPESLDKLSIFIQRLSVAYTAAPISSAIIFYNWYKLTTVYRL